MGFIFRFRLLPSTHYTLACSGLQTNNFSLISPIGRWQPTGFASLPKNNNLILHLCFHRKKTAFFWQVPFDGHTYQMKYKSPGALCSQPSARHFKWLVGVAELEWVTGFTAGLRQLLNVNREMKKASLKLFLSWLTACNISLSPHVVTKHIRQRPAKKTHLHRLPNNYNSVVWSKVKKEGTTEVNKTVPQPH